jgi:hypothetical protein
MLTGQTKKLRLLGYPIARLCGIKDKPKKPFTPNSRLEVYFKDNKAQTISESIYLVRFHKIYFL